MKPRYYDRQGKVLTLMEWAALLADSNLGYKRVAEDHVDDLWISTVWLGLDHGFEAESPPLIFETMVFIETPDGKSDMREQLCWRYSNEAHAVHCHDILVRALRAGTPLSEIEQPA